MEEELLAEKFKFIAFVSALELDDFPADHEVGIANAPLESIAPFVITSITDPVMFGVCPNITGWLYDVHAGAGATATQVATWSKSGNRQGAALSGDWQYGGFGFDASRCSSTYTGSKLQAPALQALPCIKY